MHTLFCPLCLPTPTLTKLINIEAFIMTFGIWTILKIAISKSGQKPPLFSPLDKCVLTEGLIEGES